MTSAVFLVLGAAALLGAAGAALWMAAIARQQRQRSARFLDRHLRPRAAASPGAAFAAPSAAGGPGPDATAGRRTPPSAEAVAAGPGTAAPVLAPDWLLDAAGPRALAAIGTAACAATAAAGVLQGAPGAAAAALLCASAGSFGVWHAVQRRRRALVAQVPAFLDAVVRLIAIGQSVPAAFLAAAAGARAPLRAPLERALALSRAGLELDAALRQVAARVRVRELALLAAMLGLGLRFGGRADQMLERMADFLRDTAQAEQELLALSADTRMSAWVLGLLPIVVGGAIVMLNAGYFVHLWGDPIGRPLVYAAAGLQSLGMVLLYRLSRLH
ncbi:MAG: type II secretion system F family protein [Xylophilus ampelinus]